jgi:7,8-dihydropterin-6-yl-methyl-4-(beta-D-ribofuranosyl)aminobenzene 5'-phosphate synthase
LEIKDNIQLTILVDNHAQSGLEHEHGFSAFIEISGHRILFDTGQGRALMQNSAKLGCNLRLAETLILSHGHYDHTGAISQVLNYNPSMKVYYHPDVFLSRYSIREAATPQNISISAVNKSAILDLPPKQVCKVTQPFQIYSNIWLSGPIPREHPLEDTGGPFYLDPEGSRPDTLEDDMALWIESDRGLVIITGCCHSGLINTVNHTRRVSGHEKISAIIGGFHLAHASHQRLEATCQALQEWKVDTIILCHCTGDEAVAFMQNELGEKVIRGCAGLVWK